MHRTLHRR